jgi:hypothetical protein
MPKDETHEIAVDQAALGSTRTKSERCQVHADQKRSGRELIVKLQTICLPQGRVLAIKTTKFMPQGRVLVRQIAHKRR